MDNMCLIVTLLSLPESENVYALGQSGEQCYGKIQDGLSVPQVKA